MSFSSTRILSVNRRELQTSSQYSYDYLMLCSFLKQTPFSIRYIIYMYFRWRDIGERRGRERLKLIHSHPQPKHITFFIRGTQSDYAVSSVSV